MISRALPVSANRFEPPVPAVQKCDWSVPATVANDTGWLTWTGPGNSIARPGLFGWPDPDARTVMVWGEIGYGA